MTESATLRDRLHARIEWAGNEHDAAFNKALLQARTRRLAAPRGIVADGPKGIDVLNCRIASERYGVALDSLSEVMPLGSWTPVPGQPQYLLGVTNLRGEIRPVLDLHSLLGLEPPAADARTWVIFIDDEGAEIGLRVDALERIVALDPATLTNPQNSGNGLPQRFVTGIGPGCGSDALILLDTRQILALDVLRDARVDTRCAS
ncbi:MAG: chemotaxis protein CheW [Phaeospirillum sp.]|nr:chemotaxis protein CheW [Phaeospirillum sp.]